LALGKVIAIEMLADSAGSAMLLPADSEKRVLRLNDIVESGDTIITPKGVIVQLELTNGKVLELFAEQTVSFLPELADALLSIESLDGNGIMV